MHDARKCKISQLHSVSGFNSGLQVRVLPGSPSAFNELAPSDFSETKNCAQCCATLGSKSAPPRVFTACASLPCGCVSLPFHALSYLARSGKLDCNYRA